MLLLLVILLLSYVLTSLILDCDLFKEKKEFLLYSVEGCPQCRNVINFFILHKDKFKVTIIDVFKLPNIPVTISVPIIFTKINNQWIKIEFTELQKLV